MASNDTVATATTEQEEEEEHAELPAEPDPRAAPMTDRQLKLNRTYMTILHYVLTYPRWSLSLFLVLASRSLPLPVAYESMRQPFQDLKAVAKNESRLYHECAVDAFDRLDENLAAVVAEEKENTQQKQARNQLLVQRAHHVASVVHNRTRAARRALQHWQAQATIPFVNDTNMCSVQDYHNVTALLEQNLGVAVVEDAVARAWDDYLAVSRDSLRHMSDYAVERATYDYDYFVGLKIQSIANILHSVGSPEIQLALPETDIVEKVERILRAILEALKEAYSRLSVMSARLEEFHLSIQKFHFNYAALYGKMLLTADWVQDFLPNGNLPQFLNVSAFPLADLMLPPIFRLPTFPDLPDIDTMLAEYLRDVLELLAELVVKLTEEAAEQARLIVQTIIDKIRELLTLEDYNPPLYVGLYSENMEDENDFLLDQGESAKRSALEALGEDQGRVSDQDLSVSFSNDTFEGSDFDGNATTFDYLEPSFPSFSIPAFIQALGAFVLVNQWIIEMVVQLLRLWRLRRKYERNIMPDLPEIDYSKDKEEGEEEENSKPGTMALLQLTFFKHFLTPWMALGLVLFPFAIVGVAFWLPYIKRQCIDSQNGTFMARNVIAPMLINKANVAGYTFHTHAEMQCRRAQRRECDRMYSQSDLTQRADLISLNSALSQFNESVAEADLLNRCIQVDWIDSEMNMACCGLEGYATADCGVGQNKSLCPIDGRTLPPAAFLPVGEYFSAPQFESELASWDLEDARFDCDALMDTCSSVPCDGVDADLIRNLSIEADCRAESYVVLCCIFLLLALYYAIMWNLSSTLAFHGIKRLIWRRLRPDGIKLTTHVTEEGEFISGGDLNERADRVAKAMRRFELVGRLQIKLSAIIFLAWFISFFVLRRKVSNFTEYV